MENKKNILLLSLSKFPSDKNDEILTMETNTYLYHDGKINKRVVGIYQLDPIPYMLKEKGIVLDHVIMLATPETLREEEILTEDNIEHPISALNYFKKHLIEHGVVCRETDNQIFYQINVDIQQQDKAINEATELFRSLCENNQVHLYIDNHGGFRGTQMLLNAIIELVEGDNIVKTAYGVHYYHQSDKEDEIFEDNGSDIFNFVSGIKEFLNYGRIDSLKKYYSEINNNELLEYIEEISEGIQWCNISSFELGLRHLRNYYKKNNITAKSSQESSYLQLFEKQIRLDYDTLLDSAQIDVIAEIRWCMRKGFYQQALTILEARIVNTILDNNIAVLTKCGQDILKNNSSISKVDLWNGCIYMYSLKIDLWDKGKAFNRLFLSDKITNYDEMTDSIKKLIKKTDFSQIIMSAQDTSLRLPGIGYKHYNDVLEFTANNEYSQENLVVFLFMHKTMKDIRNTFNHASEETQYKQTAINNAISYYLWLIEQI